MAKFQAIQANPSALQVWLGNACMIYNIAGLLVVQWADHQ